MRELEILTDYYPASSNLIVCWKRSGEKDRPFMDYYDGVFNSISSSPAVLTIRRTIDKLAAAQP